MISDAISLIEFLRRNWERYKIISAIFNSDAKRIEGDDNIMVDKILTKNTKQWFHRVKPFEDYVFIYMPTIPGAVYIDHATKEGEVNQNAEYFRFVNNPLSTFQSGGAPNVIVNFIIVGYRPKDILKKAEN